MERTAPLNTEPQPESTGLGTSADMPGIVARNRTLGDTLQSAETIVRNLIANAGFAFDPFPALA